ncbi:MAG: VWA domain-containing protein [Myxococcales bacterium]|nr:VWA domain-containing protein [Myxococcales bacterium]
MSRPPDALERRFPPPLPATLRDLAHRFEPGGVELAWDALCGGFYAGEVRVVGPLMEELARLASAELRLLARSCRGQRLRAVSAAYAVLRHVLEGIRVGRVEAAPPPPPPAGASGDEPGATVLLDAPRALGEGFDTADDASELLEELQRLVPWVSWHTRGTALEEVVIDRLEELTRLLERLPELKRIADSLGKLEAEARAARGVERGRRTDVVGVTVGGELRDALASELALLADPDAEDLFYARVIDRRLLTLELAGPDEGASNKPSRPGPVIACVDTSGSMRGDAEARAKALLLAVARRVLLAGRRMTVLLFGGRGSVTEVTLRPGKVDLDAVTRLLLTSYYGGTDFDGPIERALDLREREPAFARADLLFVTDGNCRLGDKVARRLEEVRQKRQLEVVSVIVGGGRGELVRPYSDTLWNLDEPGARGLRLYE